jgi:hypothetical protein
MIRYSAFQNFTTGFHQVYDNQNNVFIGQFQWSQDAIIHARELNESNTPIECMECDAPLVAPRAAKNCCDTCYYGEQ